jgi:hypothetical protein
MRQILIAMLSGAFGAVVASTFISPSFATNDAERVEAAISSGACKVSLDRPYVAYQWCFDGDVQTGMYNDTIYCSSISVTCR